MRYRTVFGGSVPLIVLVALIAVMPLGGCEKRTGGERGEQAPAREDRQVATDAGQETLAGSGGGGQPPAGEKTEPFSGDEKPAAGGGQPQPSSPPPSGQTPKSPAGEPRSTEGTPPATGDVAKPPSPAQEEPGRYKYVGVGACAMCHKGPGHGSIYEVWLATPHAKAFENLGAENQKNQVCLACHTTGYGKPQAAGVTLEKMAGVQCEACHGPGSEYKTLAVMKSRPASLEKGLILPAEQVCLGCHGGKFPEGHPTAAFNYESALLKIEHHIKLTEPGK